MPILPWRQLLLWTVLGVVASGLLLAYNYSISSDQLGGLVVTSPTDPSAPIFLAELGPSAVNSGGEHDGHIFYLMARAPMHFDAQLPYLDHPAYRLGRPVFAWAAWALHPTGGGPGLATSMLVVGVASLVLGGLGLGALSVTLGGKPWPAAVFPVILGSVLSLRISVPDALAVSLAIWAIVLLYRRRMLGAVAFGVLAALTKESVLLLFVGVLLARRDRESLVLLGAAGAAFTGWTAYLRFALPNPGGPAGAFALPFIGLYKSVRFWLDGYEPLGFVAILIALALSVVALVKRGMRHPLAPLVALQLLFLTILTVDVLGPERNASRAVLPLTAFAVVMLTTPDGQSAARTAASRTKATTPAAS